jgi:hypothetical protein
MTLGERLPREMARVACEVMPVYARLVPEGAPALEMMKLAIREAAEATARQDVSAMLVACKDLEGFHV